jgi:predicted aspartyl protease
MTRTDDGTLTVPIALNGVEKKLLLDTGGAVSQLSRKAIADLGLRERESGIELYGVDGSKSHTMVRVDQVGIGILKGTNLYFNVTPWSDFGGDGSIDGILALDLLQRFDIDLDFGAGKLNLISQDHCPGQAVYWDAAAAAEVPIRVNEDNHIAFPVTVDGHSLEAIIDTGASGTIMNMNVARRLLDVTPETPGMEEVGQLGGDPNAKIYRRTFDTLAFEGIAVRHPVIRVMPDQVNKNADHRLETGSNVKRVSDSITLPPVIIGMNILSKLHVYIAFKEHKLYITPAGPPAPPK